MRRACLVFAAALAAVASAQQDLSGYWEISGQCSQQGQIPFEFLVIRHCGGAILAAPVE